jgi:hypothetical protein
VIVTDTSEIFDLEFKREIRRIENRPVSATIGINRSNINAVIRSVLIFVASKNTVRRHHQPDCRGNDGQTIATIQKATTINEEGGTARPPRALTEERG